MSHAPWRLLAALLCVSWLLPAPALRAQQSYTPSEQEKTVVVELSRAYFQAIDAGDFARAYRAFDRSFADRLPFEQFVSSGERFRASYGPTIARQIFLVTWYQNPADAPFGIYARVTYRVAFERATLGCGYLLWHRLPNEPRFRLVLGGLSLVPPEIEAEATPEEREALKREACAEATG